jgi:ABC-type transport system involved in multi-copper enzyme maturation permease subunit
MKTIWWEQIKAVVRLEMKKTFFARRGLWIYFLALLPVFLFLAYHVAITHEDNRRASIARHSDKPLTYANLLAIHSGMTKQEVIASLGKPPVVLHWQEHRGGPGEASKTLRHDEYRYSDGEHDIFIGMVEDTVDSVRMNESRDLGQESAVFAGVFQFFFLRLAVFFGCLGIFMNLFRGEILDRSLHFYFLAPIRREILTAGKFLAGLLATCVIFVNSEALQNLILFWNIPASARDLYLYHNHGLEHAAAYLGITLLACIGYGSFFLVAGMFFKNPILPTAGILIWEAANPFLPSILKQFSVIYYLKALCPVDIPMPPDTPPILALLISNSDPISPVVAILGLLTVSLFAVYISTLQVRRMEINYTTE